MIATEASDAEYIYIKNPYEKVELNRVVKEWEWVCDKENFYRILLCQKMI